MKIIILSLSILFALSACSVTSGEDKYELKSPCVADDTSDNGNRHQSPCSKRRVNDWWLS